MVSSTGQDVLLLALVSFLVGISLTWRGSSASIPELPNKTLVPLPLKKEFLFLKSPPDEPDV